MKRFLWFLTGPVALVGSVMPGAAQSPPTSPPAAIQVTDNAIQPASFFPRPWHRRVCPPGMSPPVAPADPSKPAMPPTSTIAPAEALPTDGRYKSSFGTGTAVSAGFGIGAAVAAAAAGLPIPQNNARTATITN